MSRKKMSIAILRIFYFSITAFCVLVLLISSCKDNPVVTKTNPSYTFDTARYSWKIDTIHPSVTEFWAQDTSNIYFMGAHYLIYYNGLIYTQFPMPYYFSSGNISGYDQNTVYIGGDEYTPQNPVKPAIIKWNGAAFEEIPIPDSTKRSYYLMGCYIRSLNEIWFGSNNGKILKYDGAGGFTFYDIDTNFYVARFYTDQSNNFYFEAYRDSANMEHTSGKGWVDIYEYISFQWLKVYSKEYVYGGSLNPRPIIPFQIGNQIAGSDDHNLYVFSSNEFNKVLQVDEFIMYYFSGSSLSNIMVFGHREQPPPPEANLFHWNGKRWSKELKYTFGDPIDIYRIKEVQGRFICINPFFELNTSIVYKGNPLK